MLNSTAGAVVRMFMRGVKRARLTLDPVVKRAKPLTRAVLNQLNEYLAADARMENNLANKRHVPLFVAI